MVDSRAVGLSDAQLIAASDTNHELFGLLFDRHYDRLHRYVSVRIGLQGTADIVSETFREALASRSRYDPSYPDAFPWLAGISERLMRRMRRAEAMRARHIASAAIAIATDPWDEVDAQLDARRRLQVVSQVLVGLSQKERALLTMVVVEQMSYQDVGRALGIPIGTVRSRLNRVRVRLAGMMITAEMPKQAADG